MANKNTFPTTLQEAIIYFADYQNCHDFMIELRWPSGKVKCPHCGSGHVTYLENARRFKCYAKHPIAKFTLKTGTIFEDSPLPLEKWLVAVWLIVNCKNGISSYEIARDLGITQKSAWFMDHRIRFALHQGSFEKVMGGQGETVEVDETFIGGLSRFMHKDRRKKTIKGTGGKGKVAVFGLLERNTLTGKSKVRARVVENNRRSTLLPIIKDNVAKGSNIYTDELLTYRTDQLDDEYYHAFVNHAEQYVNGAVHTNGMENFWLLLKRSIKGTYVSVEPFHLFRYLDEQAYRFNERFGNDKDRFIGAMQGIIDKRLTYKLLTGKQEEASPEANG